VFAFCWEYPILLENNLKVNSVNIVKGSTIKTQEVKKMKKIGIIKVEKREHASTGGNERLRKTGFLPANICGKEIGSLAIIVNKDDLRKKMIKFGRNAVFKIEVAGDQTYTVMTNEIQSHAVKGITHVDFQQISLSEEVKTDVLIKIIGKEAIEAKRLILIHHSDTISVKGLPQDIPDSIEVNVSELQLGENITVGEVLLPKGIVCESDPAHLVASLIESKVQEEIDKIEEVKETEEVVVAE